MSKIKTKNVILIWFKVLAFITLSYLIVNQFGLNFVPARPYVSILTSFLFRTLGTSFGIPTVLENFWRLLSLSSKSPGAIYLNQRSKNFQGAGVWIKSVLKCALNSEIASFWLLFGAFLTSVERLTHGFWRDAFLTNSFVRPFWHEILLHSHCQLQIVNTWSIWRFLPGYISKVK